MKIFEVIHNNDQDCGKDWIAANTNVHALQVLCSKRNIELNFLSTECRIKEIPPSKWKDFHITDKTTEKEVNIMSFAEWIENRSNPDIIDSNYINLPVGDGE